MTKTHLFLTFRNRSMQLFLVLVYNSSVKKIYKKLSFRQKIYINVRIELLYACIVLNINIFNYAFFFACPVFFRFRNFNEIIQYIIKQVVYIAIECEVKVVIKLNDRLSDHRNKNQISSTYESARQVNIFIYIVFYKMENIVNQYH